MKWIILFCSLPMVAFAQGFAGLGTEAEGFAVPERGHELSFPDDHGPHPEYRIEWWYLTANLQDAGGVEYGLQWTLFRSALSPKVETGWAASQLWMGHAAVTTPDAHYVTERLGRGGIGQAGVTLNDGFEAWIDDWHMRGALDLDALDLAASGPNFSYDMNLQAKGPLTLQGDKGFSVKSAEGQASYYYSQPFYEIGGTLALPSGDVAVTGQAWLDREWSSQPLGSSQKGWDWFSLSLESGARMMGFVLRSDTDAPYTSATWIDADGTTSPMPNGAFKAQALQWSDVAKRRIPTQWTLSLPQKDVDVTVTALNPEAWMTTSVPYWEGPISIKGSHNGRGYLEMTGY
ncbi:lipocalin-like domain-containing protein [Planktotalea sp.]|uniref:lipocalin-like domain-containing protein n=1 Tax=Planktotalea sp. TaxID=2029877 RepID=UPI00329744C5